MSDPAAADPRIGSEFAGYRVKRLLGRGAGSVVYLAEDDRLDRDVALKLLAPELATDVQFRERFVRDAKLAAALDHPNVIPLYAAGEAEGLLFVAMRYVDGADLAKRLARGRLSAARALSILEPVADALGVAHAQGLIHGGVKPTNILTSDAGHVYLSDFAQAGARGQRRALTESGEAVKERDYLAPEQIENGEASAQTDVYALARVLQASLGGEPGVTEGPIDAVLARGMANNPAERHRSARALTDEIRRVLLPFDESAAPQPARGRNRRKRAAMAVLIISALLAIGVALAVLFAGGNNREPRDQRTPTDGTLVQGTVAAWSGSPGRH